MKTQLQASQEYNKQFQEDLRGIVIWTLIAGIAIFSILSFIVIYEGSIIWEFMNQWETTPEIRGYAVGVGTLFVSFVPAFFLARVIINR